MIDYQKMGVSRPEEVLARQPEVEIEGNDSFYVWGINNIGGCKSEGLIDELVEATGVESIFPEDNARAHFSSPTRGPNNGLIISKKLMIVLQEKNSVDKGRLKAVRDIINREIDEYKTVVEAESAINTFFGAEESCDGIRNARGGNIAFRTDIENPDIVVVKMRGIGADLNKNRELYNQISEITEGAFEFDHNGRMFLSITDDVSFTSGRGGVYSLTKALSCCESPEISSKVMSLIEQHNQEPEPSLRQKMAAAVMSPIVVVRQAFEELASPDFFNGSRINRTDAPNAQQFPYRRDL